MGAYATAVLAESGLASFYDLDETSGTTATDGVGAAGGTYAGTYTQNQPGQSGQGALFDGSTGKVTTASVRVSGTTSVTLEAWFKCSDVTQSEQTIINNGSGSNGYGLVVSGNGTTSGHLYFLFDNIRWQDTSYVLVSNQWYHVALVLNGSSKPAVYVNGASVYTDTGTNPIAPTTRSSLATQGDGTRFFKGVVDAGAFYSAALTAAQLLAHYNLAEAYYRGAKVFPARPAGRLRPGTSPLARGIIWSFPGGQVDEKPPRDALSGVRASQSGSSAISYATTRYGRGAAASALGTSEVFTLSHPSVDQQSLTAEAWFAFTTFQTASPFISCLWTNKNNASGSLYLRMGDIGLPWDVVDFGASAGHAARLVGDQAPHHLVLVSSPAGQSLYVDGLPADTASAVSSLSFSASALLRDDQASGRCPNGALEQFNLWNRPLSAAEVARRFAEPWGMYEDPAWSISLAKLASSGAGAGTAIRSRFRKGLRPAEPRPLVVW